MEIGGKTITIDVCPRLLIPHEIWTVIEFAELAEKGHWPVAGGVLDQAHWFLSAARFLWNEIALWKMKLNV